MVNIRTLETKSEEADGEQLGTDLEFKFVDATSETEEVLGTIEGYGAVFGNVDGIGDIVMPGAFKKSLARRRNLPMLWNHNTSEPIGLWDAVEEDDKGLKVKGSIVRGVPMGAVVHALCKSKVVSGLSIGFATKKASFTSEGARQLHEVDLWEISPVTFNLNEKARITSVKNRIQLPAGTARELEQAFRDGGLSEREAKIAVGIMKKMSPGMGDDPSNRPVTGLGDALMSIRKATRAISGS